MRIPEIFKINLGTFNLLLILDFTLILLCKILTKYRFFNLQIAILNIYIKNFKVRNGMIIILLANSYSQQRDKKNEYNILKKFYLKNLINRNEEIARIGCLSVIRSDLEFTKKLLIHCKKKKFLFYFLKAIYNSRKQPFIDYLSFVKVAEYCKNKKISIENYMKVSCNVVGYNKKITNKHRKIYIRNFTFDKNNNNENNCFILISCDLDFFDIFSNHYVSNFRKFNNQTIHFHIVSNKPKYDIIDKFNALSQSYKNLGLSIEKEQRKNKVYITMSRFLVSLRLMEHYKLSVFINDIDLTPCFNMNSIIKKISTTKSNVGFYDENQKLPWTRFAAGLCFFKYKDKQSAEFLKKLSGFYAYKIRNYKNLFWSTDQLGLGLVQNKMNKKLKIFNFFNYKKILNFDKILSVPRGLALKKIKIKFANKKFDE